MRVAALLVPLSNSFLSWTNTAGATPLLPPPDEWQDAFRELRQGIQSLIHQRPDKSVATAGLIQLLKQASEETVAIALSRCVLTTLVFASLDFDKLAASLTAAFTAPTPPPPTLLQSVFVILSDAVPNPMWWLKAMRNLGEAGCRLLPSEQLNNKKARCDELQPLRGITQPFVTLLLSAIQTAAPAAPISLSGAAMAPTVDITSLMPVLLQILSASLTYYLPPQWRDATSTTIPLDGFARAAASLFDVEFMDLSSDPIDVIFDRYALFVEEQVDTHPLLAWAAHIVSTQDGAHTNTYFVRADWTPTGTLVQRKTTVQGTVTAVRDSAEKFYPLGSMAKCALQVVTLMIDDEPEIFLALQQGAVLAWEDLLRRMPNTPASRVGLAQRHLALAQSARSAHDLPISPTLLFSDDFTPWQVMTGWTNLSNEAIRYTDHFRTQTLEKDFPFEDFYTTRDVNNTLSIGQLFQFQSNQIGTVQLLYTFILDRLIGRDSNLNDGTAIAEFLNLLDARPLLQRAGTVEVDPTVSFFFRKLLNRAFQGTSLHWLMTAETLQKQYQCLQCEPPVPTSAFEKARQFASEIPVLADIGDTIPKGISSRFQQRHVYNNDHDLASLTFTEFMSLSSRDFAADMDMLVQTKADITRILNPGGAQTKDEFEQILRSSLLQDININPSFGVVEGASTSSSNYASIYEDSVAELVQMAGTYRNMSDILMQGISFMLPSDIMKLALYAVRHPHGTACRDKNWNVIPEDLLLAQEVSQFAAPFTVLGGGFDTSSSNNRYPECWTSFGMRRPITYNNRERPACSVNWGNFASGKWGCQSTVEDGIGGNCSSFSAHRCEFVLNGNEIFSVAFEDVILKNILALAKLLQANGRDADPPSMPPSEQPSGSATADVHVNTIHGGTYDVRGEDNKVYSLLSAFGFAVNAVFQLVTFQLPPSDLRSNFLKKVHGSVMSAVYMTLRTLSGTVVQMQYLSSDPHVAHVQVTSSNDVVEHLVLNVGSKAHVDIDNAHLALLTKPRGRINTVSFSVTDGAWNITAVPGSYRLDDGNIGRRVDVQIVALPAASAAPIKPHGLIGQSLHDTFAVHGKKDTYVPNAAGEFWTSAQGEGAIEGVIGDYVISGGPFGTDFRFSRFDAIPGHPLDMLRITGKVGGNPFPTDTSFVAGAVGDIPLDENGLPAHEAIAK